MAKIRYAVVGAGWIAQEAFLPGVAASGNSVVTALVSGSPDNAAALAGFHDIGHVVPYERYEEMLAADICDAVYVALPNSLHAHYAIRAAAAGKHVLVEKPLATTVAECQAMIDAASAAGVLLMTAYRLHCEPGTLAVLDEIARGTIGEPRLFSAIFSFQAPAANHRLEARHWGGPLQDIGVYCLNAARHVFGAEPVAALAMAARGDDDPRFAQIDETVGATLRFSGGGIAQFIASFGAADVETYRVVGTKGDITLDPAFKFDSAMAMRVRTGAIVVERQFPRIDQFGAQTAYFSDCILGGVAPEPDGAEGLADVAIMRALEASAATGTAEAIDLPPRPHHPTAAMARMTPTTFKRLVF